jgi:hypothetical protein
MKKAVIMVLEPAHVLKNGVLPPERGVRGESIPSYTGPRG